MIYSSYDIAGPLTLKCLLEWKCVIFTESACSQVVTLCDIYRECSL